MACKDILDCIDENDFNINTTPNRWSFTGSARKSRHSSVCKSGKCRKLYTPKDMLNKDEDSEKCPRKDMLNKDEDSEKCLRPSFKRRKLSSVSHTATIGNGSHMDSSTDVVDETPDVEKQKSTIFRSYISNNNTVVGGNLKITPKVKQHYIPLTDSVGKNIFRKLSSSPMNVRANLSVEKKLSEEAKGSSGKEQNKSLAMSGITSLWAAKSPVATSSKCLIPVRSDCSTTSILSAKTPLRKLEVPTLSRAPKNVLYQTPQRPEDHCMSTDNGLKCNMEEEDELPGTQPTSNLLMKDIIAYVEVRTGGDNRSMGIKAHLRSHGATVRDKFTNDVTHVVFNEGLWATYKKAIKKKVHLVSVMWIEECKKAETIVSERLYPPYDMERYESPNLLKKFRKVRSLQPDFEDGGEGMVTKRRRRKRISVVNENESELELPELPTYKRNIKVPDFLQNASNENGLVRTLLSIADIGPEYEEVVKRPSTPTLSEEEEFSIPLPVRVLRKILTPQSSSSSKEDAENIKMTPTTNGESGIPVITNVDETPKRQCGQFHQMRNKDLPHQLSGEENDLKNTEAEVGIPELDIGKENNEKKNPAKSDSPKLGRTEKIPLSKPSKLPVKNILSCCMKIQKDEQYPPSKFKSGNSVLHDDKNKGNSNKESEVKKDKKQNHSELKNVGNNTRIAAVCGSKQDVSENHLAASCIDQSVSKSSEIHDDKSKSSVSGNSSNNASVKKRKLLPYDKNKGNSNKESEVRKGKKRKHSEVENVGNNTRIAAVCGSKQDVSENQLTGSCIDQPVSKSSEIPDDKSKSIVSGNSSKNASVKKRKLLPMSQCSSPESLELTTDTETVPVRNLECPYATEEATQQKKKLCPVDETSTMELTTCAASTSVSERITVKARRRNIETCEKSGSHASEKRVMVKKVACSSRSSSAEFVKPIGTAQMECERKTQKNLPSLVCTSLQRHEVEVVACVVQKLGGFIMEANVSPRTTHVVTQGPRRTINLLKGIARGCWIVLHEWVLRSLDAEHWLEEDEFELTSFSPAVQCRLQKLSFGPVFKLDLFSSCGAICVSKESVPSKQDLEELITLCGGRIVIAARYADLFIGKNSSRHQQIECVNEKWVLDSIQFSTLKSPAEYAL